MTRLIGALLAASALVPASGQSVTSLKHAAPDGSQLSFLLTDGTVLAQGYNSSDWWRLTPDATGSYVNGTWKQAASLAKGYAPSAFSSAVLADGRLVIEGGEYNNGNLVFTALGAVFDPVANTWTPLKPPAGWGFIGDSPSTMLPDGRYLLGRKFDTRMAVLDPKTLTWTAAGNKGKADFDAEEGWTLLPDGTVLTVDVKDYGNSERYTPQTNAGLGAWSTLGKTGPVLAGPPQAGAIPYGHGQIYHPPGEVGPALLMPDGSVFATGATPRGGSFGHTAIWRNGVWSAGPNFPTGIDAGDNFAVLLPNGTALVETTNGELFAYDGKTLSDAQVNAQGNPLLLLPTGQVLIGGGEIYTPTGAAVAGAAPTVTNVATTLKRGSTYAITGTQFNGLSQAHAFGDELQTATNYPLVRLTITATGHVVYARTHDHSTMGVATGNKPVSTSFDVPQLAETGSATLQVVANGIASAGVAVTIQ